MHREDLFSASVVDLGVLEVDRLVVKDRKSAKVRRASRKSPNRIRTRAARIQTKAISCSSMNESNGSAGNERNVRISRIMHSGVEHTPNIKDGVARESVSYRRPPITVLILPSEAM